ncbi:MAG TPA: winged helix DNA-binding domain-containing protein [Chitinophagales bacterium]|nr:winged helix DNA-binding domain-containing protein [Chitinophagales bacterium]
MTASDIVKHRLINQQIAETKFKKPHEIVSWMGAVQAQDFAMAKWAIGLRLSGLNDADVEKAFNDGAILRTHMLRPTWHFVTPADIRWMLALTSPRVNVGNAHMYRKLELDNKIFKRSNDKLAKTLLGGKQLTRSTLKAALEKAKISSDGLRLGYLLMRAELDGIICSGPREGKQFTYALLEERVPSAITLDREEALAELTKRYFASRGPATLQDFAWWSGLTMKDARAGMSALSSHFVHEHDSIYDQEYLFVGTESRLEPKHQSTFLMPDYDEYGISYRNRSYAQFNPKNIIGEKRDGNPVYNHMLVVDGVIRGTWRRVIKNKTVFIEITSFITLNASKNHAVVKAVRKYIEFVGSKRNLKS